MFRDMGHEDPIADETNRDKIEMPAHSETRDENEKTVRSETRDGKSDC